MAQTKTQKLHEPVLLNEVLEALRIKELVRLKKKPKYIDATVGLGGHTKEIICLGGNILGIEADPDILEITRRLLREACPTPESVTRGSYTLVCGNFINIEAIAKEHDFYEVDGVLFDLGITSLQLTSPTRGFSFQNSKASLDMRLDPQTQGLTATDLLNGLRKDQLYELFSRVLRPRESRRLSEAIVRERVKERFEKVEDFIKIINKNINPKGDLHVATLPFLALRIAVNSELENLSISLPKAFGLLGKGGRLVVISFHSGEDAIVKNFYKKKVLEGEAKIVSKKPIIPTTDEISRNPRARSAKMRVLERIWKG